MMLKYTFILPEKDPGKHISVVFGFSRGSRSLSDTKGVCLNEVNLKAPSANLNNFIFAFLISFYFCFNTVCRQISKMVFNSMKISDRKGRYDSVYWVEPLLSSKTILAYNLALHSPL